MHFEVCVMDAQGLLVADGTCTLGPDLAHKGTHFGICSAGSLTIQQTMHRWNNSYIKV